MKTPYLALLAVLVMLTGANLYKAHGIEALLTVQLDFRMTTYTATWTSASGTHTVSTTRAEGETAAQHAARHRAEVDALQAIYPPIQ